MREDVYLKTYICATVGCIHENGNTVRKGAVITFNKRGYFYIVSATPNRIAISDTAGKLPSLSMQYLMQLA